jgi:hypothetical protein
LAGPQVDIFKLYILELEGSNTVFEVFIPVDYTFGTAVPTPAAAWLFGSALLGLGVIKRKKA